MKSLIEFIQNINQDIGVDLPKNWQMLTDVEIAQKFIKGLNQYIFQTYRDIGKTTRQGEEFQYFSDFHRFWEANHQKILQAMINREQAHKVARAISNAIEKYGQAILKVKHDTAGLHPQGIAQVRFFTANQDFREPPEKAFEKYIEDPIRFDSKEITDDPIGFLGFLGIARLSQTDKRIDFARNAASFLEAEGIKAYDLACHYDHDARQIRDALTKTSNIGYGQKKANMFIRDMVELGVWPELKYFEEIDVASDINTMKLALRTRIVETAIPLLSSFLDIFCYQYEYIDEISAKAWRTVWEEWRSLPSKHVLESPCLMDFLLYRIGREYCRDNLINYHCEKGHEFFYFGARLRKCRICRSTVDAKGNLLPCRVNPKDLPREQGQLMLPEKNLLRTFNGTCILENVCSPKSDSFRMYDPPKSISIKGQTGWTSAYAFKERGGGGLMS